MNVTGIEELKKLAQGEVVELPGFADGEPFVARLKRPSLMGMAAAGAIPNPLLGVAEDLFNGKTPQNKDGGIFKDSADMFRLVAEHALVEPSYAALREIGLELTDMQMIAIFNYTQMGAKALERFRSLKADTPHHQPKQGIPAKA